MRYAIGILAVGVILAGCTPTITASSQTGVTIHYIGTDAVPPEAAAMAEAECRRRGRRARFVQRSRTIIPGDLGTRHALYDCVTP